jgi:spermidine synthase
VRRTALRTALAAIGFTSTIGQLTLLRELIAVFYGNELVLGLILAVWLACVAAGAWGLGRKKTLEVSKDFQSLGITLAAAAFLLPAQMALVREARALLGVTPGALVALGPMVMTILLALAPLCLLLGWGFTLGARLLTARGGTVGAAYVAESLGALLGGAAFSFLLVRWLDPFQTALGVGALDLAAAAALVGRRRWLPALGAAVLAVGALPLGSRLHRATLGWQYADLRLARDSIYGRIVVTGSGEQRVFFENGLLFFETQGVAAEEVAHLPLLAHPQPRRVLLVGGGVSGTLAETLRHPSVEAAHYVELDPLVVAAARAELPPQQAAALDDPRVTLAHVDGRLYVRQRRGDEPFDAVILDLPEPATGQLNRFYTQEFFAEVKAILAPGGVFALGLPWQENYPGPALQRLAASVYRTLAAEFPHIALLPGERLFLLASDAPLATDPATWSARLVERGIAARWVVPEYLAYLLTTDRIAQARDLLEAPIGARLNRDLTPVSTFYALTVWLSRFYSRLSQVAAEASLLNLGWLALPLAVAALLLRRWAVPTAIGCIGLAEMGLEVVILFAFQVVHGYVYGQVGLIVTAFMAGLALGGSVANRWRWPGGANPSRSWDPRRRPRAALAWILVGVVLFSLAFPALVSLRPPAWAFPLLALVAGGLTGLAFPVAVACARGEAGQVAGRLYGADLVGGCLGAALTSVLLVPILGIPQTCLGVALVGLAGLAVLI